MLKFGCCVHAALDDVFIIRTSACVAGQTDPHCRGNIRHRAILCRVAPDSSHGEYAALM
jgi:hypothetical protein